MMEGNRRSGSRFGQIPVKEGDEYDVEIEGIGEKGDGIAKVQGYVIIVPNVSKGDKVKVRINAVRGKVSFGEVIGESDSTESEEDTDSEEDSSEETEEDSDDMSDESDDMDNDSEEESDKQ